MNEVIIHQTNVYKIESNEQLSEKDITEIVGTEGLDHTAGVTKSGKGYYITPVGLHSFETIKQTHSEGDFHI